MRHVHIIGIGGVGMNGIAQLAVHAGFTVSGSDRAYESDAPLYQCLHQLGITIHPQDGSAVGPHIGRVIYSTAIEDDNPDLIAAREHGIPLLHRAEFLKQLIGDARLIAVAGTAGKTTTTGMLGWIFEQLGHDPTVYNGAAVLNWKSPQRPGNVRTGSPRLWIIEADESDKSFLQFHPTHAIITNISRDHYELDELQALFDQFSDQTSGTVVQGRKASLDSGAPQHFTFSGTTFELKMPGRHNLDNALCAVRLCCALGMDLNMIRDALSRFEGIERRLEIAGSVNGIMVIDDYAHNATKIAAALSAVSETGSRIHTYWRPHGFTPLFQGLTDIADSFIRHWKTHGGSIFILPVYYAGGSVERKATSENLVDILVSAGVPARLAPDYDVLKRELELCACSGDTILGLGARDPELPMFAKRLVTEWKRN